MKETVFKIGFTMPAPIDNWSASKKASWAEERAFYSCSTDFNYLNYILNKSKTQVDNDDLLNEFIDSSSSDPIELKEKAQPRSSLKSIDEYMMRGGSIGVFDLDGDVSAAKLKEFRDKAAKTQSNIWHGWISVDEITSKGVNYETAKLFMAQTFGNFLRNAELDPDNIALICALHTDKPHHHHIHFSFYEKEPLTRNKYGRLGYRQKGALPQAAIDEFRISSAVYLDNRRDMFFTRRDRALYALNRVRHEPLPTKELFLEVLSLARALPKSGRLQYNSENIIPYRKQIDEVALRLIRSDAKAWKAHEEVLQVLARKEASINKLAGGKNSPYIKKITEDYKSRLGNSVLKLIKSIRFEERGYDKSARVGNRVPNDRTKKAISRRLTSRGVIEVERFLTNLGNQYETERNNIALDLNHAEREIQQQQQQSS